MNRRKESSRGEISIEVVREDSQYLTDVKRLWSENRATLGFFPDGAFSDRAQKGQILAAVKSGVVAGYALYSISSKQNKVSLTHLCVDKPFQKQGIARQLIDELRIQTNSCRGIGLFCRRDYSAIKLWPKLGFVAISEKRGKSQDGHELTYYWIEHQHKTLFSSIDDTDSRMKVVIDANIFYDIEDPTRKEAEETWGLMADWIQPLIQLCISEELYNEIQRIEDSDLRKDRMQKARGFDCLICNTDEFHEANTKVQRLLGDPKTERDASDQRHLARTIVSDAMIFVTRDNPILKEAEHVYEQYGLSVLRPSELISHFEELRNEQDYQRARLVGTDLKFRRAISINPELIEVFQDHSSGERAKELNAQINTALSYPEEYGCHIVETDQGEPQALYVTQIVNESLLSVPIFRIASNFRKKRLALTLARTLLSSIIQYALNSKISIVKITEKGISSTFSEALQLTGFVQNADSWIKVSINEANSPKILAETIRSHLNKAGIEEASLLDLLNLMENTDLSDEIDLVLKLEHVLWPVKLIDCNIPNYIISIKPRWASDLFDAGLANEMLWGAEVELALNPESVYYRSIRPSMNNPKGRILWYVSSDNKFQGSKRIRACSQLREIVVGPPKELYQQHRRFGVYEWKDVLSTAGSPTGNLMAIHFADTELFPNPIKYADFQSILQRFSIHTTLQSPTKISEKAFLEIYRLGLKSTN
ncbi:MAG: hypothetical protein CME32_31570 [Gimesia sp.]|nr:hypothetical protein [Gimesia sp.]